MADEVIKISHNSPNATSPDATNGSGTVFAYTRKEIRSIREILQADYLGKELPYDTLETEIGQVKALSESETYIEGNGALCPASQAITNDDYFSFTLEFSLSETFEETKQILTLGHDSAGRALFVRHTLSGAYSRNAELEVGYWNTSLASVIDYRYLKQYGHANRHTVTFEASASGTVITVDGDAKTWAGVQDTGGGTTDTVIPLYENEAGDRVYSLKLYKGGTLVCDLTPVEENGSMYWHDAVTGTNYASTNGTALAGSYEESQELTGTPVSTPPYGALLQFGETTNPNDSKFTKHRGSYRIKSSRRIGKALYRYSSVSLLGMLETKYFTGGLYNGESLYNIMRSIFGYGDGRDTDVSVYGWIPYCTCREAAQQLCFAYALQIRNGTGWNGYGQTVLKTVERLADNSELIALGADQFLLGGSVEAGTEATAVELTEHGFYEYSGTEAVVLFDNSSGTSVSNQLVQFSNAPIRVATLAKTGTLTFRNANVNCCYVSGIGTLTGIPYEHSRLVIRREVTGTGREEKTIKITDATLVTVLNSESVADRVADYYFNGYKLIENLLVNDEIPGRLYEFTSSFGESVVGYLQKIDKVYSAITKARCEFLCGLDFDQEDSSFTAYALITADGSWTVPTGVDRIRAVLIGGGTGGDSGHAGAPNDHSTGGKGGAPGSGGSGGRIYQVTLDIDAGTTITVTVGSGGAGGARVPGGINPSTDAQNAGSSGTASQISYTKNSNTVSYSSSSGAPSSSGVANAFTGEVYGTPGENGTAGGNGGNGARWDGEADPTPASGSGDDVGSYTGGSPGANYDGLKGTAAISSLVAVGTGGAGGGAAAGRNGTNGFAASMAYDSGEGKNYIYIGFGGNGANATDRAASTVLGGGGDGGHGGGGSGGTGVFRDNSYNSRGSGDKYYYEREEASGTVSSSGNGGAGGTGGPGCVLIYY